MVDFILVLLISIYIYSVSNSCYISLDNPQKTFLVLLFIIHFGMMWVAYNDNIVDAISFYKNAKNAESWLSLFGLGSAFMSFLIYPLVKIGVSMFVLFLLFATISYKAFLWYFNQMISNYNSGATVYGISLAQMFFLLPSLHYWSSFLGKDVLIFFFLTYLLFEFKMKVKLNILHFIVLVVLLLLRPHVFFAVFFAFFIFYFSQKEISIYFKIKLSILALTVVGFSIPIIMYFGKIKHLTYSSIIERWSSINNYAIHSRSGINLTESNYLDRIWLLLFRPLFYDATTIYQYIVSIENSFMLFFFILVIVYLFINWKAIVVLQDAKLALLIGICIVLMISIYIYNLGLASRMRLMFLPLFFYALHQLIFTKRLENK